MALQVFTDQGLISRPPRKAAKSVPGRGVPPKAKHSDGRRSVRLPATADHPTLSPTFDFESYYHPPGPAREVDSPISIASDFRFTGPDPGDPVPVWVREPQE